MASIREILAAKKLAAAGGNKTPVAKDTSAKAKAKAVEVEDAEEDEEVEEVAVPAKRGPKPKAKAVVTEVDEDEDVPVAKPRKGGFASKKVSSAKSELKPGDWMQIEEFYDRAHKKLKETLGDIAPESKSVTIQVVKAIEELMQETLKDYDLKWMGAKFKRTPMSMHVYAPSQGLEQVATPYHTLAYPHTKVSLTLYHDKVLTRGDVDASGNFIEGQFDASGKNFTPGTWEGKVFTPAKAKKSKK